MRNIVISLCLILSVIPFYEVRAETFPADPEFDKILAQDISDLTVISVAKRSQRLSDTTAAVYVITQEEIRRAGIYTIPDALRLVPGLQVAKLANDDWAVASRGFNSVTNNKMLVLIDGRAVYTPVFSGVYWGDQSTTINDIDRIEVIRGPGASLYGANAVNGVIHIITKSAEKTQGTLLSATTSVRGSGLYEARRGVAINDQAHARVYGQYLNLRNWYRGRAGFRMDGNNDDGDSYTLQGDAYGGSQKTQTTALTFSAPFSQTIATDEEAYGGNVLGRWTRDISSDSTISLQAYVDHYARLEWAAEQRVTTSDLQFQHNLNFDGSHHFIWGAGARLSYLDIKGTYAARVNDRYDVHEILSAFVQDEYALIPDTLYLTAGSKFEYNDFTGFEIQPTLRALWHPTENQSVWGSVSRAVRTPSRIEEDISILGRTSFGIEERVLGNPNQETEELIAYELGHRVQFTRELSFDTALFYNDYERLQTIGFPGATFTGISGNTVLPYMVNNEGSGHVYGAEFAASWNVNDKWRLAGSYSYMEMNLDVTPAALISLDATERRLPQHQFAIQSYYNLSDTVQWDNMIYFVDALAAPVNAYVRYDTRIAWMAQPGLEISLIGRNLIDPHVEFPGSQVPERDRSLIGQVLWKF